MSEQETDTDSGELSQLSVAPYSGETEATQGKRTEWTVGTSGEGVYVSLEAREPTEDMYTAIANGYLSGEEARDLRDALTEALGEEN